MINTTSHKLFHRSMYRGADKSLARPGRKRLTGHLQSRRNWPTWASNVLINHPILRIWPRRTTTCSLDWKNNWKEIGRAKDLSALLYMQLYCHLLKRMQLTCTAWLELRNTRFHGRWKHTDHVNKMYNKMCLYHCMTFPLVAVYKSLQSNLCTTI
jgi:hypothetical protein